jgi:hypothetical protein
MVLYPLAVVLLAQLGILMLVIIFYQRLQKKRLIKELENSRNTSEAMEPRLDTDLDDSDPGFDKEQAALLLNRINQSSQDIISEAPAAKELCKRQEELISALSDCLDINLDQPKTPEPAPINPKQDEEESDDILSQEDLDEALGESPDDLEGLEGFEGLDDEPSQQEAEEYDPLVASEKVSEQDDDELPEDTLQKTLDNLDEFDFSDLEEELLKDDDKK